MSNEGKARYRWPWVVLILFLLALLLSVLWMRVAVKRVRDYRFGVQSFNGTSASFSPPTDAACTDAGSGFESRRANASLIP